MKNLLAVLLLVVPFLAPPTKADCMSTDESVLGKPSGTPCLSAGKVGSMGKWALSKFANGGSCITSGPIEAWKLKCFVNFEEPNRLDIAPCDPCCNPDYEGPCFEATTTQRPTFSDPSWADNCAEDKAKYCQYNKPWAKHTMCEYCGIDEEKCNVLGYGLKARGIPDQATKDLILDMHNDYRRKVAKGEETKSWANDPENGYDGPPQPPASNMYKLKWSDELARIAQRWADQCVYGHDKNQGATKGYEKGDNQVGQNIAMMVKKGATLEELLKTPHNFIWSWTDFEARSHPAAGAGNYTAAPPGWPCVQKNIVYEGYNSVYTTCTNPQQLCRNTNPQCFKSPKIGHYTQVVWAKTKEVGCGYVDYGRQMLVCNYGPSGNFLNHPVYNTDMTASCPEGSTEDDGLCVW